MSKRIFCDDAHAVKFSESELWITLDRVGDNEILPFLDSAWGVVLPSFPLQSDQQVGYGGLKKSRNICK